MARILIAEDEPRISAFIDKGLSAYGFAVTVVTDGQSAYDYAVSGDFDLMILDIGLPRMDGFADCVSCARSAPTFRSSFSPPATASRTQLPAWKVAPTTTCRNRFGSRNCWPECDFG